MHRPPACASRARPASLDKGYLAIRAVDHSGNIGPLRMSATTPVAAVAELGSGPFAALSVAALAIIAALVPRRRRRMRTR